MIPCFVVGGCCELGSEFGDPFVVVWVKDFGVLEVLFIMVQAPSINKNC